MNRYSDPVLITLEKAGWCFDGDISDKLKMPKEKRTFRAAAEIYASLGLLKLEYYGRVGREVIYFDVDDSDASKKCVLRCLVSMTLRIRR